MKGFKVSIFIRCLVGIYCLYVLAAIVRANTGGPSAILEAVTSSPLRGLAFLALVTISILNLRVLFTELAGKGVRESGHDLDSGGESETSDMHPFKAAFNRRPRLVTAYCLVVLAVPLLLPLPHRILDNQGAEDYWRSVAMLEAIVLGAFGLAWWISSRRPNGTS
jgi:hypothetical protein